MKKSKQIFLFRVAILFIVVMFTVSFQSQTAKVTGTWNMTVETSMGPGTPVFILKQENDSIITGSYIGQFGEAPVKGTIKANKMDLKFEANNMSMEYIGIIEGNSVKGKVVFGTMGEVKFTGIRKEK